MGSFYVSYAVRTSDAAKLVAVMQSLKRKAFVMPPQDGVAHVYDEASDTQDDSVIRHLGARLSRDLGATVLAVLNHDDDMLFYWLFEAGSLTDEYNSFPGFFQDDGESKPKGGDARKLAAAFGGTADVAAIEKILRTDNDSDAYAFALDRHIALAGALGLPDQYGTAGFNYARDDRDSFPDGDRLVQIG